MPAEMGRFSFLDPSPQALDLSAANTAKNMPDPVFLRHARLRSGISRRIYLEISAGVFIFAF